MYYFYDNILPFLDIGMSHLFLPIFYYCYFIGGVVLSFLNLFDCKVVAQFFAVYVMMSIEEIGFATLDLMTCYNLLFAHYIPLISGPVGSFSFYLVIRLIRSALCL